MAGFAGWTSSELLSVELRCIAHRRFEHGYAAEIERLLVDIELIPITAAILERAGEPFAPPQRALDAIHLATLLDLGLERPLLVTYDAEQATAARAAGIEVHSPA